MAPKKKQTKTSSKAPKQASAKPSTTTRSAVAKKPAAKPTAPTRKQPARKAAQAARREEGPADDADDAGEPGAGAGEERDREASPRRKSAPQRPTLKRKAPEDGNADGDGPAPRRPASKRAKTGKGKGKTVGKQRGSKRPREQLSDDEDAQESGPDSEPPSKPAKRRKIPETPDTDDPEDPLADEANPDADAVERQEDPWREVDAPLATTDARIACQFEGNPAELIVSLRVFSDPFGFRSRLGYLGRLQLARTDDEGEQLDNVIGYIQAWRISKPTTSLPQVNTAWLQEILSNGRKAPEIEETVLCLQALFTGAGVLQETLRENTDRIAENPLMFIQMIYTRHGFQSKGLLRPALDCFYTAIGQLPQWFAFAGNLVLVPSAPADYKGRMWEDFDADTAEETLIGVYRNRGYAVWVRDAKVRGNLVTVMGRATP